MIAQDIIRAWKDEHFRKSLSIKEQQLLPDHPAGEIVLSEKELARVNGSMIGGFTQPVQVCDPAQTTTVPAAR